MNITEFLLARIGEDEAAAGKLAGVAHSAKTQVYTGEEWVTTPISTERVLAECAAKRAIIEAHRGQCENDDPGAWIVASNILLKSLAAVYKDHPDYDAEWAL